MLSKLLDLFKDEPTNSHVELDESQVRLASAALLIEVAVIDNEFDGSEMTALREILIQDFQVESQDIDELITLAHNECSAATSMFQFTQLVNKHCTVEQKFNLVTNMWRIAFADGDLDKYEEYIIRKVADLIYLAHGEFIRAKHVARSNQ